MFGWTNKIMNESDLVWIWVHRKYGMSRIVKLNQLIKGKKPIFTMLLPMMSYWVDEITNDSDEVWR